MHKKYKRKAERQLLWVKRHYPIGSLVMWTKKQYGLSRGFSVKSVYALVIDHAIADLGDKSQLRVIISAHVNNENIAVFPSSIKNIGKPYQKK